MKFALFSNAPDINVIQNLFTNVTKNQCKIYNTNSDNLIFNTLWANLTDDKLIFFLFSPENKIWYFMQIVTIGDNWHIMSKPVFSEKLKKKYFKISSAENFTQKAKP